MNILQFADYSAPYEGNFILSLKHLENKLTGNKIVYLFTKDAKNQVWIKNISRVYFLTDNIIENIKIFKNIIKKENIDIIHTHFSMLKYDLALKIARTLSKKTLYIRHMHMIYKCKRNLILEKIKKVISNADIEIACSDASFSSLKLSGIEENKIFVVPNAIAFERFDTFENLNKESFSILIFGYNYYIKGVDLAIRAVDKLVKNDNNIILQIVIAKNDNEIKDKIIKDFGKIPDFVRLLAPRNDIATYYKNSDIFLSSSREESFCYAIREATYCEALVIASDIPAHNDIPIEFRFINGDYKDLYKKIKLSLTIKNKKDIIEKSKRFVIQKYSIDSWSDKIIEIYNNRY
jgi:glycosyltransferase involved in cell wall biosynthesis